MRSTASDGPATEQVGPFQFAILVLSVLALAVVAADTFLTLPHEVSRILQGVDLIACAAFFTDFLLRFRAAESKWEFMRWGWLDLLASVPNLDVLRVARFVRILRVLRLLRGIRSLQRLFSVMYRSKVRGGAVTVGLTMFLLVVFSSVGILLCETTANANIRSAGDAVWWSVTTVTTVGYGDRYPVTAEGRMLAIGLMFAGVGMFGAFSGLIASAFLGRSDEKENAIAAELQSLRAELVAQRTARALDRESPATRSDASAHASAPGR